MSDKATYAGTLTALAVAVGGWLAAARKTKVDSVPLLVQAAIAIANEHRADEQNCKERLDVMQAELNHALNEVEDCERRHAWLEQAIRSAGIDLPDMPEMEMLPDAHPRLDDGSGSTTGST